MAIRRCPKNHFYDDKKYDVCPVCLLEQQAPGSTGDATVGYTVPVDPEQDVTIGYRMIVDDAVAKPTVGWVVCVKGSGCGRDWRLHEGRNDIGTTPDADVPLAETGRKEARMCSVVYDGKHGEFLLAPGNDSLVYLNGVLLSQPSPLENGDEISVGESLLCFQSFGGKYY